jgi:predicted aconitase/predicted aconitase with swiveling domain
MSSHTLTACHLTGGAAQGHLLFSDTPLSFWGGVHPATGEVIDRHHPLSGQVIAGQVLAIPSGRGSCTGSSVLMEIILNGHGPAALVLEQPDEILALGAIVAELVFDKQLPVVTVGPEGFAQLRNARWVSLQDNGPLTASSEPETTTARLEAAPATPPASAPGAWAAERYAQVKGGARRAGDTQHNALPPRLQAAHGIHLRPADQAILDGQEGRARQVALQIVLRMARLQGATELIDVVQAHIDGCIYTGSASLRFAAQLRDWGGQVKVPTTLNSISVDQRRWRALGIDPAFGEPASALAQAYVDMGAQASFTCAPYLLDSAPKAGEDIVWAESNAVVYANSVLGAHTAKYADFLDICIALIGRAPKAGCHLIENRRATLRVQLPVLPAAPDDAFYPLLGYLVGLLAGARIPVICGLESAQPSLDDLKAFGAAFATTSAAPMFHIVNVTPEAPSAQAALAGRPAEVEHQLTLDELRQAWHELDSAPIPEVDLVALGNPHFSETECHVLAKLLKGRQRHPATAIVLTLGRAVSAKAERQGDLAVLADFGVTLITDTCWCMLEEPVVPVASRVIMTNSGKYAHYAPGLTGRLVHFGSLAACAEAACTGQASGRLPAWLVTEPATASARN